MFRLTFMGSTLASSVRLHKIEYHWAFFILMAVLEMLKVSCIKPDEGKMFGAPIIVFNPKTLLVWVIFNFFSGNHIFQLFFYTFALSLGRLLILQNLSSEFVWPLPLHTSEGGHRTARSHSNTHMHMKKNYNSHFPKESANHFCFTFSNNYW